MRKKPSPPALDQKSEGHQSPVIKSDGDTNITYEAEKGLNKEQVTEILEHVGYGHEIAHERADMMIELLEKNLQEKELALHEEKARAEIWIQKYKELEDSIAKRPDEDVLAKEAQAKLQEGRLDEAQALLEESFERNLDIVDQMREKAAKDAFEPAKIHELKIDYYKAQDYYEKAVELCPYNSLYLNDAGFGANRLGQSEKAIDYFEKALSSDLAAYGEDHPEVAIRWNNLGGAWQDLGQPEKAMDYYQKALASNLATYGEHHPKVAIRWNNLGRAWHDLGQPEKAINYLEKALASNLATYGQDHPAVAIGWNNLGSAWQDVGNPEKANDYYEKALAILQKVYGNDHPSTKMVADNIEILKKEMAAQDDSSSSAP